MPVSEPDSLGQPRDVEDHVTLAARKPEQLLVEPAQHVFDGSRCAWVQAAEQYFRRRREALHDTDCVRKGADALTQSLQITEGPLDGGLGRLGTADRQFQW